MSTKVRVSAARARRSADPAWRRSEESEAKAHRCSRGERPRAWNLSGLGLGVEVRVRVTVSIPLSLTPTLNPSLALTLTLTLTPTLALPLALTRAAARG